MGVSSIDVVILVNLGLIHVVGLLLVLRYWDRLDGSDAREASGSVPTRPDAWCADARGLVDDIAGTLDDAEPPIDAEVRQALIPPTTRLRRLVRSAPERLDEGLVQEVHSLNRSCRDLTMSTGRLTGLDAEWRDLDRLDSRCNSLKAHLETSPEDPQSE